MRRRVASTAQLSTLLVSAIVAWPGCTPTGDIVGAGASPGSDAGDTVASPDADPAAPDADPAAPDAAPGAPDAAPGAPDAATPPPLTECTGKPSIDRLEQWLASGEGLTVPATGSLLVAEGDHYVARVQLIGSEWHVIVVWLKNQFEDQVDLSGAASFTLTYSATDDLYVQLRPEAHWSGGDKYVTAIPSTHGQVETHTFSFDASAWTTLPELGVPSYPYAEAIRDARGLVFVGDTPNTLEFRGLRIDGFTPPCL
jgi:hypothetical protein